MDEELRDKLCSSDVEIQDVCRRWNIEELSVFGSALRADFGPDSYVDVLVKFAPAPGRRLTDHIKLEEELTRISNRRVDVISRRGVEASRNWLIRQSILETAEVIYESG